MRRVGAIINTLIVVNAGGAGRAPVSGCRRHRGRRRRRARYKDRVRVCGHGKCVAGELFAARCVGHPSLIRAAWKDPNWISSSWSSAPSSSHRHGLRKVAVELGILWVREYKGIKTEERMQGKERLIPVSPQLQQSKFQGLEKGSPDAEIKIKHKINI